MFRRSQCGSFTRLGDDRICVVVEATDTVSAVLRRLAPLLPESTESGPQGPIGVVASLGPSLWVEPTDGGWSCCLELGESTWSQATRERLPPQLSSLVAAMADDPECAIECLPLCTPPRQRELVDALRGPRVEGGFRAVIRDFEAQALRRPDAVAVASAQGSLRYAELDQRADRLAHWLAAAGVRDGMPVVVSMDACVEFIVAMLAVFKAGGALVPLEPTHPAARREAILDEIRPTVTLTHRARASQLDGPHVGQRLVLDDPPAALVEAPAAPLGRELEPGADAYVIYTSGTTGRPKGVRLSQANLAHYIGVARDAYGYADHDVIPAMARFSFSITFFELLSPLSCGATLRLLSRDEVLDHDHMMQVLRESTCIHASPSWWRKLIAHIDRHGAAPGAFDGLRHVSSGGDMVPPDVLASLARIFTRAEVFVIYGCSEVACMGCTYPVSRAAPIDRTRVGRAFPNVSVRLLDPAMNVVPPGFVGEVYFGGAGLATGYLHAPELTQAKFVTVEGERLYRTGDLGRIDDEGNLELLGRADFQIKLRGFRIEPAEVEVHLRTMPAVADAVVAAPVLDGGDKALVAYVVAAGPEAPSARSMRRFLRDVLPDYMVPAHFVRVDALPVNHNGKIDRRALPVPTPEQLAPAVAGPPPRTDDERRLLAVWRGVLGRDTIGIHDDFFDLGGDSLIASELMTRIDRTLGVPLPVSLLLTHPTVAELAARLDPARRAVTDDDAVVCLRPGAARPAIFFVHDGGGETIVYRNLARRLPPGCPIYGVHPRRSGLHPILHTRISQMVEYYAAEIRRTCSGPYVVGGLCIGGFLAFEVARLLRARGESVPLVVLLDAPHVKAPKVGATSRRLSSLSQTLGALSQTSLPRALVGGAAAVATKLRSTASYELRSRAQRRWTELEIRALRYCLDHGRPIPAVLQGIGVDPMLRFAELEYQVPGVYEGEVVLFRASHADPALDGTMIDDTPYREILGDPMLGWEGMSTALAVEDVDAGHSSMLQEPTAAAVAAGLQRHLDRVLAAEREPAPSGSGALGLGESDSEQQRRIVGFAEGCSLLVVIVSYRTAALVIASLEALQHERGRHRCMRVVVVDNTCGADGAVVAAAIVERGWDDWATVQVAAKNGGFAYGNNLAIRLALRAADPPSYLWLLNPDTQVCPGASRALVELLGHRARAGIVGSCLVDPDGTEWGRAFRFPSLLGELEEAAHLWPVTRLLARHVVARKMGHEPEPVDWISGASMMIRREVFEEVGLFDEGYFLYYEETDFCLHARRAGWHVWYVPDSRVMHIAGESTGVTARGGPPRRIPEYVFDSRRRYFVKNHGIGYAALTDLAKVGALASHRIRRRVQRRVDLDPPWLLWDSIRSSVFLKGPRRIARRRHD